jgi:glycosyltransferase involved in cell wall biosynthesis
MHKTLENNCIVMVGPDMDSLGGISRVVKIWETNGYFENFNITYIASVSDSEKRKKHFLFKTILRYILLLFYNIKCVYVHTSSYNSFLRKLLFIVIAIIFRKKIILHIHPTHFYKYLTEQKTIVKYIYLSIIKRIDKIIVLTNDMQSKMENIINNKNIYVLPNAVDVYKMRNKREYRRKNDSLLYLGWYIKKKGVYELVDAVEELARTGFYLKLVFCGTKEIEKLRSYVLKKSLNDRITINGWIGGEKKNELLYSCTAIILPSHSEGMPNVILEAMATKTPIISTSVGGLKEILQNEYNSIIIKEKNVKNISEKIRLCFQNDKLRKKIANNAYDDALHKYDVRVIKQKFENILLKDK